MIQDARPSSRYVALFEIESEQAVTILAERRRRSNGFPLNYSLDILAIVTARSPADITFACFYPSVKKIDIELKYQILHLKTGNMG